MRKVNDVVEQWLDLALVGLFIVMVAAIVWQVFARYVLEQPTVWSEELARYVMVWVTMLGSAHVLRQEEGHVAVTVFVDLLPEPLRRVIGLVRDVLIIGLMGALAWYGYAFAMLGGRRMSSGLGVSMTYPYLAIPAGAVLIGCLLLLRRTNR